MRHVYVYADARRPRASPTGSLDSDPSSMRVLSRRDFKHKEGKSLEWQLYRSTRELINCCGRVTAALFDIRDVPFIPAQ
jgi:hypothetical protein